MWGWQIKLCDPLVTHGPYLSALAMVLPIIRRYANIQITLTLLFTYLNIVYSTPARFKWARWARYSHHCASVIKQYQLVVPYDWKSRLTVPKINGNAKEPGSAPA